jgi:ribose transport system ATP-binding protein
LADLELRGITKRFGAVVALQEASLSCEAGQVHGLVGENGAGKSTMVKILSGAVRADSGEVRFRGQPLTLRGPADAIRAGIGMIYQELSDIPDLTVAQNIWYGHEPRDFLRGTSSRRLRQQTLHLYDEMGVEVADPDERMRDLSLAQRQMVEIAKIVARRPEILVLDEPTSALSRAEVDWLVGFIGKLAGQGKIIIYISHNLNQVRDVSDQITVLRNGQHVGSCITRESCVDDLVTLILGRKLGRLYPPREVEVSSDVILCVRGLDTGDRLKDVSFDIRHGEILGVGGLTGQGQYDLFRSLFGLLSARGEIRVNGSPVRIRSPQDALSHRIGIALVPEDRKTQGLFLTRSVTQNASAAILRQLTRWGLIDRKQERGQVDAIIKQFSIVVADPSDPVMRLSGGNQQKVVLGKLLAAKPKILLLYDSFRGVDIGTKGEAFALLRQLTASGTSVLFYSTTADELLYMCDRVLVMRQGKIEAELQGGWLTEENLTRASMGVALAPKQSQAGLL